MIQTMAHRAFITFSVALATAGAFLLGKKKSKMDPVAKLAESELDFWNGRSENDPTVQDRLTKYWKAANSFDHGASQPWSAAFVSYVANRAAPGSLPPSASHMLYAGAAKLTGGGSDTYVPLPAETAPVQPGDIVIKPRAGSVLQFSDINGQHQPSHGDIVIAVTPTDEHDLGGSGLAVLVGGNVDNTVKRRTVKTRPNGTIEEPYFAVLRRVDHAFGDEEPTKAEVPNA